MFSSAGRHGVESKCIFQSERYLFMQEKERAIQIFTLLINRFQMTSY